MGKELWVLVPSKKTFGLWYVLTTDWCVCLWFERDQMCRLSSRHGYNHGCRASHQWTMNDRPDREYAQARKLWSYLCSMHLCLFVIYFYWICQHHAKEVIANIYCQCISEILFQRWVVSLTNRWGMISLIHFSFLAVASILEIAMSPEIYGLPFVNHVCSLYKNA